MIEGVLVDSPESLVEALADLGDGRIALVSSAAGDVDFAPTSLAARVRGPLAIRRLLSRLHVAESLDEARALQARLDPADSVITRDGERFGAGWLRVLRSVRRAPEGALLREREIQGLRERIGRICRPARLSSRKPRAAGRERLLAPNRSPRTCSARSTRRIARLGARRPNAGQQGRLDPRRNRIGNIDVELASTRRTRSRPRENRRAMPVAA